MLYEVITNHIGRRQVLIAASALLAAPLARGQTQGDQRIRTIGYLTTGAFDPKRRTSVDMAIAALRKLGWIEGQNIVVERRSANNQPQRLVV